MAAVTTNGRPYYNIAGSLRHQLYNITGSTGQTLDVGLTSVLKVNTDAPAVITAYTVMAATPTTGMSRITFTGGPFTAVNVEVLGN